MKQIFIFLLIANTVQGQTKPDTNHFIISSTKPLLYLDTIGIQLIPLFTQDDSLKMALWSNGDIVLRHDTILYEPKAHYAEIYKFFWKQIDSLENELDKLPK